MKKIFKNNSIFLGMLLSVCFLFSCTEEISVNVPHDAQTVIFGFISNDTAPISIFIQQTVPLNSAATFTAVNDAMVSLHTKDTSGNTSIITNDFIINQGNYTSIQPITAQMGNTYWIEVLLSDGTLFTSTEEILKPIVVVDEITIIDEDFVEIVFNDPANDTNFYSINVELLNNGQVVSSNTSQSNDVVFNGNENATVEADLFPFEDEDDEDEILIEYDEIKVTLGNINFDSYQFLLNRDFQQEANDSDSAGDPSQLFSTPPVSLFGNITNTTAGTTALGNFTITSLSILSQDIPD